MFYVEAIDIFKEFTLYKSALDDTKALLCLDMNLYGLDFRVASTKNMFNNFA